ncbi:mitochondrial import receptor subunit TOM40 homolog 1-like [Belonocnema kinseyi]|uniref:mitochondrial import receptor subunit TOM40 homolog 1-like n=1 Tax=Belonocnema kinseyi TaxID=2817044 RepID=UPI00143CEA12|nr:mitochondrial import receptor subunit TOM40 homolog 1-like [Belonocnema kinseyi]XP_033224499.1 mitochondrial import receptor subunit TOM40 homolog 1-like [Belonocnema kinseyi]
MGSVDACIEQPERKNISNCNSNLPCTHCPAGKGPGNPGCLEEIHKKVKDLYPRNFEGAKLIVKKSLSQHFNVTHSIIFSSVTPSGYRFGTRYIGTKRVGHLEKYPVICGEIVPNGNLTATLMHTLGCRYRLKLAAQVANQEYKAISSTLEYRSNNSTMSLTLANPSILKQHGTLVLHYLQAITSRMTLGAEMACQRGSTIPGHQQTIMSLAFRYSTGRKTLSTTVGEAGVHVCFHMKASHQFQIGVEIETNFRTHESEAAIVYQMDLPHSDLIFRGLVNSESTVSAVIEKKLHPFVDSALQISGLYNHKKEQFRIGVGLNVG